MSGALKRAIAQRLCPDVFLDAERWHYARSQLDQVDQWCSVDIPAAGKVARWVLDSVWRHFMPLAQYHSLTLAERMVLPEPIDAFRRELRRDAGLDPYWPHLLSETPARKTTP